MEVNEFCIHFSCNTMKHKQDSFKEGFIPLGEYVQYFKYQKKGKDWIVPLRFFDKIQIMLLSLVVRYSWFNEKLFIENESDIPPHLASVITVLKRENFIDVVSKKEMRFPGYYGYSIGKNVSLGGKVFPIVSHGIANDKSTALSKALGESVERIVSGLRDENRDIVKDSFSNMPLSKEVIYPPRVHRFLDVQKKELPELRHTDDRIISWVKGRSLFTGNVVLIPKEITSWFYGPRTSQKIMQYATTNGSSGYFTKEKAVMNGLFEVIERDAFFVHWLTKIPPLRVDVKTLPKYLQEKVELFKERGYEITIFATTTNIKIPTIHVLCSTVNDGGYHKITFSGACRLTYEEAVERALEECMSCGPWINDDIQKSDPSTYTDPPFLSRMDKFGRYRLWSWNSIKENASWLEEGNTVSFLDLISNNKLLSLEKNSDDLQKLDDLLFYLKKEHSDLLPVIYIPKNKVADSLGFIVVQVYIEKLFPLYLIECYGTFDSDRLVEFSRFKGRETFSLNTYPHPML
jgi:ribosomal protein S12 methylthiotransferase accessory factor